MSYENRLSELNTRSLQYRRAEIDLCTMYKCVHGKGGVNFDEVFTFSARPGRGHPLKVNVPFARLDLRKNFFSVRGAKMWNDLPVELACSSSFSIFRKNLEEFNANLIMENVFGFVPSSI